MHHEWEPSCLVAASSSGDGHQDHTLGSFSCMSSAGWCWDLITLPREMRMMFPAVKGCCQILTGGMLCCSAFFNLHRSGTLLLVWITGCLLRPCWLQV